MDTLAQWWYGLGGLNQWFYMAAAFFSVIFLWQMIMALTGLSGVGGPDIDTHVESGWEHDAPADAHDTLVAFKLVSVRSVLAFFTLFSWAGALYLGRHLSVVRALAYALLWGLLALALVSLLLNFMRRLTESGNPRVQTAVGAAAMVYLDIPANGTGEIRVLVSSVMTHLKARATEGAALKAGTAVRVTRMLAPDIVEVTPER